MGWEVLTAEWGWIIGLVSILGLGFAIVSKGKKQTRTILGMLGAIGVGIVLLANFVFAPAIIAPPGEQWQVTMTKDNDATHWADPLGVADADLWADAAESDCNNVEHKCTVIITATQVGSGVNTMAPDEFLIKYEVERMWDDPGKDGTDDVASASFRFSYAHATWTNTTSGVTYDAIYKDADSNWICYLEEGLTAGGTLIQSGKTYQIGQFDPNERITFYLGCKFNAVGFGADGQTAGVSKLYLDGTIAGYSFEVTLSVATIS